MPPLAAPDREGNVPPRWSPAPHAALAGADTNGAPSHAAARKKFARKDLQKPKRREPRRTARRYFEAAPCEEAVCFTAPPL